MDKPSLQDKDFLTVIETAELFGLSRRKMFRLTSQSGLPFMAKYGTRKLIIKDEFIKYRLYVNSWGKPEKEELK